MSDPIRSRLGRNARRGRKAAAGFRRLGDAARATMETLETRQLLTAVIANPDPVIPWSPTRAPLPAMPGHTFYVSGIDPAGMNGQWDNSSAVTPNTTNDLILNKLPTDTNYVPCCEATSAGDGMNNIAVFTNGTTQSTPGGTPSGSADDASAEDNVIADLNGTWHATYSLGTNPNGYNISEVDLIAGHQDYRTQMGFDVSVEPVGSTTFYSLSGGNGFRFTQVPDGMGGTVTLGKGGSQAALINSGGGNVAANIQAVRFDHLAGAPTFWREFVVTGTAATTPVSTGTPTAPTLSAMNTPGSPTGVTLTLTNTANNQQGFQLERSTDNVNFTQISSIYSVDPSGTKITLQDTSPIPSGTVYYRARAFNGTNESPYSATAMVTIVAANGWEAQYYMSDQANQTVWDGDQVANAPLTQPDGTDATSLLTPPPSPTQPNNAVLGFERLEEQPIHYTNFNDSNAPPGAPASFNTIEAGNGGPGHDFAVRWTGYVTPTVTGYYTLMPRSDDGAAVTVFDTTSTPGKTTPVTLQPDNIFHPRGPTTDNDPVVDANGNPVLWTAGQKYLVQMDYNNEGGGWEADLSFAASSTTANQAAGTYDALPSQLIPIVDVAPPVPTFATIDAANPTGQPKDDNSGFYSLVAAAGPGAVQLQFNNIDASSYNIYRSTTPFTAPFAPPASGKIATIPANSGGPITYTDNTVTNGTTYYYLVTGVNPAGEGNGITTSAIPGPVPAATGLTATPLAGNPYGVMLSFTNGAPGPKSFLIQRSSDGTNFTTLATLTSTAPPNGMTTYKDSTLPATGGNFSYRVITQNFSGQSSPSNVATITVPMAGPLNFEPDFSHGNPMGLLQFNSNGAGTPAFAPVITASTDTPPNALQLLDNQGGEAESVFSDAQYNASNFDTTFDFQWGGAVAADGFTFTLQNNSANALGGGGGALGYQGIPNSVAVIFNLYNNVSQTGIAMGGVNAKGGAIDVTMQNGTATGIDFHANPGDTYEAHLKYDGTTLHETLTDLSSTTSPKATFTHDYTINIPMALGGNLANVGFTAGTGGATTSLYVLNWMYNPGTTLPVNLVSTGFNDGTGTANQTQRSEVRDIVLTFDHAVTLGAGSVGLSLLNTGGSGTNNGAAPTNASAALGTPTSSDGGLTWLVPVLKSTTFSDATGSLKDGIYTVAIDPTKVTGGTLGGTNLSTTFHRLFGDINGDKTVNNTDYFQFNKAFGSSTGSAKYNPDFDFNGDGTINNTDYFQFNKNFAKKFTY